MKAVVLIAVNFVREQRWPIFVLLLWVLLLAFLGLVARLPRESEDLLFIFKQVAVYVVAFSVFFGGSAVYNERKSRRILCVLSKAISRRQYASGLVLGIVLACGIYCFSLGLTGSWTLQQAGFPIIRVWTLMLTLLSACALSGTIALTFSTFLNPFIAAGATALFLGAPVAAGYLVSERWFYSVPVYELVRIVLSASFRQPGPSPATAIVVALAETVLFWEIASRIFSYVDIAVAVE